MRLQAISTERLLVSLNEFKQQQSHADVSLNSSRDSANNESNNEESMAPEKLVECQIETPRTITPSMSQLRAEEIREIIHGGQFMVDQPDRDIKRPDDIPIASSIDVQTEPKSSTKPKEKKLTTKVITPKLRSRRIKNVPIKRTNLQNGKSVANLIKLKEIEIKKVIEPEPEPMVKIKVENQMDAVSFLIQHDATKATEINMKDEAYLKRKHKCEVCGKRFVGKSNLIDHLRYHANVKPYECTYCDRKFVQVGSLRCHLRTHTREKPYTCNVCEKKFSQPSGLKVHIRTHTNERNYVCPLCGKAFISKGDLTKHQRIHDPVKKFICEICSWGFSQKCNLLKHNFLVHGKKDAKENDEK